MKIGLYWKYASRSLLRGGQRSLLAIFCIAVGVLAIVSLQFVTNALIVAYTANVRAINGGDLAVLTDTALTASQLTYFDGLRRQGVITDYTAENSLRVQARGNGASLRITLRAVNPHTYPLAGSLVFTSPSNGSLASLLGGDSVVITTRMAEAFNLAVGSHVHFSSLVDGRAADVTVSGIIQSTGMLSGSAMLMDYSFYASLPSLLKQTAGYNTIYLDVPGHTDANATVAQTQVKQQFPLATTLTAKQFLASQEDNVQQARYFLQIIGLLALLIGGVGIVNTIQVALRRRRTEIAMLKTAGYRRRDLYALFGLETGLMGLLGGLVGTAAGVGVSTVVNEVVQNALQISLPLTIDAGTLVAGVAVGCVTALVFGLLPIAQASAARPVTVLCELTGPTSASSRLSSIGLTALVALLFFLLAQGILQSPVVALLWLAGTGIVVALLSVVLGLVVGAVSRLPVPQSWRWELALLVVAGLAAGAFLLQIQPVFGVLVLVVAAAGVVVLIVPHRMKASVKLALRNIGRQRAHSVATLVALATGIFAIGLVLTLGQNIQNELASIIGGANVNIAVIAGNSDRTAVQQQLSTVSGLANEAVNTLAVATPTAINGQPINEVLQHAVASGNVDASSVIQNFNGVQGHELAASHLPSSSLFVITRGDQDTVIGRNLRPSDTGTTNALVPVRASSAPLSLKLGDHVSISDPVTQQQVMITVVGFYQSSLAFEPIQMDSAAVTALAGGQPSYLYTGFVDPNSADSIAAHIQAALPTAQVYSLADTLSQINSYLNNLTVVLTAIASLAMLAAIVIIANAVALSLLERRRELGILKAVGFSSGDVLREVLVENGIIGFTGGLVAMAMIALTIAVLGKVLFNAAFGMPLAIALTIVPATAVVCMVVAALVTWQASHVRPLEVLRYE